MVDFLVVVLVELPAVRAIQAAKVWP